MRSRLLFVAFAMMLAIPLAVSHSATTTTAQDEIAPLKIGALLPFTGDLSDFGQPMFNAIELAVTQINEAGGVNGQPIELVQGDDGTAPQQAVDEARRLVDVEGVNAIIGPAASGVALQVVEAVTGPGSILHFSHSATSNELTAVADNDFFFRTTIADSAQGKVMAEVAQELGYTSACTMYINGPYGEGLSKVFAESFEALGGTITAQVPHESAQGSFVSELTACTEGNPDVLVAISYPESMSVYLREAVEQGLVENFLFSDGGRSPDMFAELGWEAFEGMQGTSAGAPDTSAGDSFDAAYEAAYDAPPSVPYLREGYDAVYLIALAAEVADSNDPTAMRDVLRDIANPPGEVVAPGVEGWQAALELIAAGTDVDFEGAAGSQNLDENGDVLTGTINIWAVQGEEVVVIESRDVDLSES